MTHPIVPYARTAYASGWAASGGPMTDRVRAGCIAAIEWAIAHADDPDVIEATLKLGSLEGVWALIYARRDQLYADNVQAVLDAWKQFVRGIDVKQFVRAIRSQAGLNEAVNKTTVEYAAGLILGALMNWLSNHDWLKLQTAVANAIQSGLAEGQVGAMALVADKNGATGFSFDKAFADASQQYANNPYLAGVTGWIGALLEAIAKLLGKKMAQAVDNGDSWDDMNEEAEEILNDPVDATHYIIDQITHLAISAGILWWLRGVGAANIWYITAGDERVCAECDSAEANSPYQIMDVPTPPLHTRCRCSLYTDDPLSGDLIAQYLGE
ncbi:MAG TPA: hypothetical protein VIY48_17645 [Candidatus Paceibacterota bacterium]